MLRFRGRSLIFFSTLATVLKLNAASIPAFSVSGGTVDFMQFQFTIGDQFFVNQPITVTNLGAYSISGLAQAYEVGLWDSSGSLLASANVPATTLSNQFVYVPITPVLLPGNQPYHIGELVNSAATWLSNPVVTSLPQITFQSGLFDETNSSVLTDPLAPTVGFGGSLGPTFEYTFVPLPTPTPEPGTGSVIAVTALIVLILRQQIAALPPAGDPSDSGDS
jgi:hypothetical protein